MMQSGYGQPYNAGAMGGYGGGGGYEYGGGNNQPYAGGYQPQSQPATGFDSPSGKKKSGGAQPLRAMTIKQVLNAQQAFPEAPYMADGHEVGHVSIVACIRRVADQSTNLGLLLEDGTGVIDARMWHDESDTDYMAQKRGALRENVYVHVIGHLRSFSDKRHIAAFSVRPVTDFNEITHHNLEALYTHLHLTRGPLDKPAPAAGGQFQQSGMPAVGDNGRNYGQYSRGANDGGYGGGDPYAGQFSALQSRVMEATKANGRGNEGISIHFLIRLLAPEPQQNIQQTVEWLVSEGHMYPTIDDHYQVINL